MKTDITIEYDSIKIKNMVLEAIKATCNSYNVRIDDVVDWEPEDA